MSIEDTRDIAVEARTLAREAHNRIGGLDEAIIAIRTDLALLRDMVIKVNTKVGIAGFAGGIVGSGAIAAVIHYLP
jgi:hypothetical protein